MASGHASLKPWTKNVTCFWSLGAVTSGDGNWSVMATSCWRNCSLVTCVQDAFTVGSAVIGAVQNVRLAKSPPNPLASTLRSVINQYISPSNQRHCVPRLKDYAKAG